MNVLQNSVMGIAILPEQCMLCQDVIYMQYNLQFR